MHEELRDLRTIQIQPRPAAKAVFRFRPKLAAAQEFQKSIGGHGSGQMSSPRPVFDANNRHSQIAKKPGYLVPCGAKDNRTEHFPDGLLRHKIVTAIART